MLKARALTILQANFTAFSDLFHSNDIRFRVAFAIFGGSRKRIALRRSFQPLLISGHEIALQRKHHAERVERTKTVIDHELVMGDDVGTNDAFEGARQISAITHKITGRCAG